MSKICGECKNFQKVCNFVTPTTNAEECMNFEKKARTNRDKIRKMSNEELAKTSIYKETMSDGEIIYRSTLIVNKFFLTKSCAVSVVEAWLNAPAESKVEE